jgi:hypothetical protein
LSRAEAAETPAAERTQGAAPAQEKETAMEPEVPTNSLKRS